MKILRSSNSGKKRRVLHGVLTKIFSAKTKISTLIGLSKVRVLCCNQDGKSLQQFYS